MIIDLHVHSKHSDGVLTVAEIFNEAKARKIGLLSITDHDSIDCQESAISLAREKNVRYLPGVELNVTFSHPKYRAGKPVSLDFLGYNFEWRNKALGDALKRMAYYRESRAVQIIKNLNAEFEKEGLQSITRKDFDQIQASIDGVLGRPHIADYLVGTGVVKNRQEAFDKYLVKCDVPKYPLHIEEASKLMRDAGGKIVLSHPNDPHGTSLATLTKSLSEQTTIIEESMLRFIDGVECWHSRHDPETTRHYVKFAEKNRLVVTGGSDCHQKPIVMGTVDVPEYVAGQFCA